MNRLVVRWFFSMALCLPVLAGALVLAGCLSTHPGSTSIAYVDVESGGFAEVRNEAIRVFADEGYRLTDEAKGPLFFERVATQKDKVMYGRYTDDSLVMRVVVSVEPRREGGSLVRADAYVVRDGVPEKVLRMARRPYQKLLDQVRESLAGAKRSTE